MPDKHRRDGKAVGHLLDVGGEIIEARYEQRFGASRRAMAAKRQRMCGVALFREPRQKVRGPTPGVAEAAMDEQERRLGCVTAGPGRQARAKFEVRFKGKHGR